MEIAIEKSPITDAWERDEAEPWGCMLTAPGVIARPWGVPMKLIGFPVGRASWEVFGLCRSDYVSVWGMGLVVPETGNIFRNVPFYGGPLRGLYNGCIIAIEYRFNIQLPGGNQ